MGIVIFSNGCKKSQGTFSISGKISNMDNNNSIAEARVYLDAKILQNGVYNSSFTNIASATSQSDGNYSFEIEEQTISDYRFRVVRTGYFDIEEIVSVDILQASNTFSKNFKLTEEAWVELIVNNTMPQDLDDEINYRFSNIEVSGKDCCSNELHIGIGPTYSATTLCKTKSSKWIKIEWVIKKNGGQVLKFDSIYTDAQQTATYHINY